MSALLLLPLAAGACGSSDTVTPAAPASVSVTLTPAAVETGVTAQAAAVVRDAANKEMSGRTVTWAVTASTPAGAATVNATTGLVSTVAVGTATITATVVGTSPPVTGSAQLTVNSTFASISVSGDYTCGIRTAGPAFCWGINTFGQLGDGTTTNRSAPVPVSGGLTFTSISVGGGALGGHACGLVSGGVAYCWGANISGEVGDGTTTRRTTPTLVSGGLTFASISSSAVGDSHTCGVTTNGSAYCWGDNGGQLGDGTGTNRSAPTTVLGGVTFASVSAGAYHTCGITTAGKAYCWGYNFFGQIGDGTTNASNIPVAVSGGLTFASISAGELWNCGVTPAGIGYCWGAGGVANLGNGSLNNQLSPAPVAGGLTFQSISAASFHACGVTTAGAGYCWGDNNIGEVGDGTTVRRLTAVLVSGGLTFRSITAGGTGLFQRSHTCGLTTSGIAYCWGGNASGQLGTGTTSASSIPVRVIP